MGITRKLKQLLKKTVNRSPLPVWYSYGNDLAALRRKINLWIRLSPSNRKNFANEISFLNSNALLSEHWTFLFPYSFVFKYDHKSVRVNRDNDNGLFYVMHNGRRLYYSRSFLTETAVQHAYNGISIEQDDKSPHRYTNEKFFVGENETVLDIGAAEGNFALDVVERAGMVYIIEPDKDWIEALKATFRPWKDKVHIINKFASDTDSENCISLAGLLGNNPVNFIKMDVGGAEERIIISAERILRDNSAVRLAICTYHRKKDAETTVRTLAALGFTWSFTNGYMLYVHNNLTPPYFRKTLIRAQKQS